MSPTLWFRLRKVVSKRSTEKLWAADTFRIESTCGAYDCQTYWAAGDATHQAVQHPGLQRQGATQLLHITALYKLLDDLRA